jgi:dTDP-4-dehydrorhamnose reductase
MSNSMHCLVVGADGSFGGALSQLLRRRGHDVLATTRRGAHVVRDGFVFLDLAAPLPEIPRTDVAVICAAMARFEDCRRFPELAHRVNVTAPLELSRSLVRAGGRVIFLSTSAVFDGKRPHVPEGETPSPGSAYGILKAEAERHLLDLGAAVSVLRMTKVVKPNAGLLSDWTRHLAEGRMVRAFDDLRFCPIKVEHVVDAIVALIEGGDGGIYQVSGAADISYLDAARFLARRIGVGDDRVAALHGLENGVAEAELPRFTSMASGRLSRLTGFSPPEPFDVLQDVYGPELDAAVAAALPQHSSAAHHEGRS